MAIGGLEPARSRVPGRRYRESPRGALRRPWNASMGSAASWGDFLSNRRGGKLVQVFVEVKVCDALSPRTLKIN